MSRWDAERTPSWAGRAVMALTLLALVLVAVVPLALLAGVVMMVLGHVTGGLALFGGSILAAVAAVALAGLTGLRHLRKLISGRGIRIVPLGASQYGDDAPPQDESHPSAVRLDRSEYTEVR
jgi:uncharacterized membrane protein